MPPSDPSANPRDGDRAPDVQSLAIDAVRLRRDADLLRVRRAIDAIDAAHAIVEGRAVVNFSSNDYLGLSHDARLRAALAQAASDVAGAGAAPLITGRTSRHASAERAIADWKGVDDAVLLPSGYQANLAAVGSLAGLAGATGRRVRFIADKLVHASLIDAIAATDGELRLIPHNGLAKLERLLDDRQPDRLDVVVTESVFSMDGDEALLADLVALRARYRCALVVDEAHASGLLGPGGAGLASEQALSGNVDLGIATFSKALGLVGGAVYGSTAMIEAVVNFARPYIYSTSPPAFIAAGVVAAIDAVRSADDRRACLARNVSHLRQRLSDAGIDALPGRSPIVPILLGSESAALDASGRLLDAGYLVVAVRPPTVPRGTSRLRLTLSSEHSAEQIDGLVAALCGVLR